MNATINVLLYKSKTLSNGEHPIMLRICKDNKKKYRSLGISVDAKHWNFEKNEPRRNCPNRNEIITMIAQKMKEYSDQILDFKVQEKDFTATGLLDSVDVGVSPKTVKEMFDAQIGRLKDANRLGYALSYSNVLKSLLKFNEHLDIYFSDIDITWLRRYEDWLRSNNLSANTIGIRFRTLRALYNLAIEEKVVKQEYYPFDNFKVSKFNCKTPKRALRRTDIEAISKYQTEHEYTILAIDIFLFTYLTGGTNFMDISYLTKKNIIDGRLIYTRKKTKKLIQIPLQDKAIAILEKYSTSKSDYLFPILSSFHKTEQQKAHRIHKVISKVNKYLKAVGQELNLPIDLTTYVARHTYATVLKRSGVNTSIISESLGHSSEKVTQIYLDSFENSQIDEAMKNLL